MAVPILLLFFWIYMAYRAFSHGNLAGAGIYLVIGIALTVWRLSRV